MSRDPPQRREARFAKRRCALQPGSLTAGLQGAQATARQRRRDRNGRCRPVFQRQGWKPEGRRRFTGSVHDSPPRRGRPEQQQKREQYQEEEKQNDDNGRQKSSPYNNGT
ncbi:hypothetical protein HJ617_004446 [Salmonella enterica]|nr:hypothetical protein [Salmonella enterica]